MRVAVSPAAIQGDVFLQQPLAELLDFSLAKGGDAVQFRGDASIMELDCGADQIWKLKHFCDRLRDKVVRGCDQ